MKDFGEFFQHYLDTVRLNPAFDVFTGAVLDLEKLIDQPVEEAVRLNYYRLIYTGVFGALESYLCDTFIKLVVEVRAVRESALSNNKIFDEKYSLSDVASDKFNTNEEVVRKLSAISWHNLDKVRQIYISAMDIKFPHIGKMLRDAVWKRHDIVHRNGRKTDGSEVVVSEAELRGLIKEVEVFAYGINMGVLEQVKNA